VAELLFLDGVGPRHLRVLKERKEEGEKKKKEERIIKSLDMKPGANNPHN